MSAFCGEVGCGHASAVHTKSDPYSGVPRGCALCGCLCFKPETVETLRSQLSSARKLAADRMVTIRHMRMRARPDEPGYESLARQLARALERTAIECHRADELHRALNGVLGEAVPTDGVVAISADTIKEAEEALETSTRTRAKYAITCKACGAVHGLDEWKALAFRGLQELEDFPAEPLEMRNCACGSTLAIPLRRLPL